MANHVSDFKKAPEEIIFDLLAFDNPSKPINATVVSLGIPTIATGDSPPANTDLEVASKAGSGYVGNVVVHYNRLAIQGFIAAAGVEGGSLILPVGDAVKFKDVIPEINTALGINVTDKDYIDGDIGDWEGTPNETKKIDIITNADSLVFTGTLTLTLHAEDIELSSVITVTTLSGLNYPVAPAPASGV